MVGLSGKRPGAEQEDSMELGKPRVRTRTTHDVTVPIEDGPIYEATRGRHGHHRFRPRVLRIGYVDGELSEVRVEGDRLNADGQPHARGDGASVDYLPYNRFSPSGRAEAELREDTPQWVRDVVAAHPWPGPELDMDAATNTMRAALMATGAVTLAQVDEHAPGLARAVVNAAVRPR